MRPLPSYPVFTRPCQHGDMAEPTKPEERYLDRELSWLAFNTRVLELAEDPDLPLLERARFLAIFSSNLDEFYMIRVAGLKRRIAAGVAFPSVSGMMPREVLERTLDRYRGPVQMGRDLMVIEVQNEVQVRSAPSEPRQPRN